MQTKLFTIFKSACFSIIRRLLSSSCCLPIWATKSGNKYFKSYFAVLVKIYLFIYFFVVVIVDLFCVVVFGWLLVYYSCRIWNFEKFCFIPMLFQFHHFYIRLHQQSPPTITPPTILVAFHILIWKVLEKKKMMKMANFLAYKFSWFMAKMCDWKIYGLKGQLMLQNKSKFSKAEGEERNSL